jgi:hypothetical protein
VIRIISRSTWRSAAEDGVGDPRPRLVLQDLVDTLRASMSTLTSLQPFLALLQGSANRLRLGLVRQRGDLGGQRLGLWVLIGK